MYNCKVGHASWKTLCPSDIHEDGLSYVLCIIVIIKILCTKTNLFISQSAN